jgi:hypothetical protein
LRDKCVSPTELSRPDCNKMSLSQSWQLWFPGSTPFQTELRSHKGTPCDILQSLTQTFVFWDLHVFLQLVWIRPIWKKMSISSPSKFRLEVSIPFQSYLILTGQQCASCSCS